MDTLVWSPDYELHIPAMDQTHQEFVQLLTQVQQSPDSDLLAHWRALIDHTQVHFDTENHWMKATRFAASNCHSTQHEMVLKVMRDGLRLGAESGQWGIVRQMANELVVWFPHHAASMDAALASHLQHVAYDPHTQTIGKPENLPAELLHGCGGNACSEAPTVTTA